MKRTIVNPHWINNARTVLSAEFHYDDGRILSATISDSDTSNPDLAEIKKTFSEAELEKNTRKKNSKMAQEQEAEKLTKNKEHQAKIHNETLQDLEKFVGTEKAKEIIKAIAKSEIKNLKIVY